MSYTAKKNTRKQLRPWKVSKKKRVKIKKKTTCLWPYYGRGMPCRPWESIVKLSKNTEMPKYRPLKNKNGEASLSIGDCYIKMQDYSKAIDHFNKIKREASTKDWELIAGVENGLAACYLEQGEILKARRLAIKVLIEYYQAVHQRARALFLIGKCYESLNGKEEGALGRAKIYYEFLKKGYPNSEWTLQALKRLQEIIYKN